MMTKKFITFQTLVSWFFGILILQLFFLHIWIYFTSFIERMKQIPFAARWILTEDELYELKESEEFEYLESKYISTSTNLKYWLEIYPDGDEKETYGKVMIYLGLKIGNLRKVGAKYTVMVESADNYLQKRAANFKESTTWGECFCDTVDLFDPEKKFIADGQMVLIIEGIFEYENNDGYGFAWFPEIGKKIFSQNISKDFVIAVDGKEIKAHKFLLRARSPVFAAMFRSKMKEDIENRIEIIDFSYEVIEKALMLVYDNTYGLACSGEQTLSILQFSDKYQFQALKDDFETLLINQICVTTVCCLTNWSIITNALKLQQKCEEFLMIAFDEKTPLADLDELDKDILLKIFQNNFYKDV